EMPVTLGGVLALLVEGQGARLAREHGTEDTGPDSPVVAALTALLGCAWVDAGRAQWKPTWSGRDEVIAHDGTPLGVPELAARAVAGAEGARELRTALAQAGVSLYYEARMPVSFAAAAERETAVGHR
ncbi:MAG: hypothetical protein HOV68_19290, partial [Streptomycetaceae bacterium]|nr:hypothetical protein [Streptomycetaceae bacterium]